MVTRFELVEWTQDGRNYCRIYDFYTGITTRASGSREAMEAAKRLLFPPEWEELQNWRRIYYKATGTYLWNG